MRDVSTPVSARHGLRPQEQECKTIVVDDRFSSDRPGATKLFLPPGPHTLTLFPTSDSRARHSVSALRRAGSRATRRPADRSDTGGTAAGAEVAVDMAAESPARS